MDLLIIIILLVSVSAIIFGLFRMRTELADMRKQSVLDNVEIREVIIKLKDDHRQAYTELMSELKGYTDRIRTEENEVFDEELYELAKKEVIGAGKASTSYLQRKLGIGYARAAHLIDMLEENGVIGPAVGAKPRFVLEIEEQNENNEAVTEPEDNNDELYESAKQLAVEAGKVSTAYLQRKLSIGYARAAQLIEMLEEKGVVVPGRGATPRTILKEKTEDE